MSESTNKQNQQSRQRYMQKVKDLKSKRRKIFARADEQYAEKKLKQIREDLK